MATQKGRNTIIHLKIKDKRTTASVDTTLADLVCLKLADKLSRDGVTLTQWAQNICENEQFTSTIGISALIRSRALLFICDDTTRKRWMSIDD